MAEEQGTHVIYKGKHYIIPGQHSPEEAYRRVLNLTGSGPKLREGVSTQGGFEDTSAEAKAVLGRYPEPNRARDILPKLAEFAVLYGSIPGVAGLPGRAVGALKGLSAGQKAVTAGKAAVKAGAYGVAGVAANEGLQAAGVPRGVSEAVVGAAGLATKPVRAMLKAGAQALAGETAAAPVAARAATAAPAVAEAAAAPAAAAAAPTEAEKIAAQLIRWKEGGMSGGQMVSALRQVYRVPMKDATQMVKVLNQAAPPIMPAPIPPPTAMDDPANLVMGIQQRMATPGGRAQVNQWLAQQPPEVAAEIKALLARRQAGSPTIYTPTPEQARAQQPGYELAKMLGQVQ